MVINKILQTSLVGDLLGIMESTNKMTNKIQNTQTTGNISVFVVDKI